MFVCSDLDGYPTWGVNYHHRRSGIHCQVSRGEDVVFHGDGRIEEMSVIGSLPAFSMVSRTAFWRGESYIRETLSLPRISFDPSASMMKKISLRRPPSRIEHVRYVYGNKPIRERRWKGLQRDKQVANARMLQLGFWVPLFGSSTHKARLGFDISLRRGFVPHRRIILAHQGERPIVLPGSYWRVLSVSQALDGKIVCGVLRDASSFSRLVFAPIP